MFSSSRSNSPKPNSRPPSPSMQAEISSSRSSSPTKDRSNSPRPGALFKGFQRRLTSTFRRGSVDEKTAKEITHSKLASSPITAVVDASQATESTPNTKAESTLSLPPAIEPIEKPSAPPAPEVDVNPVVERQANFSDSPKSISQEIASIEELQDQNPKIDP
ncbi:uncharacterized protein EI90DRAFT_2468510 [Cantharellus anzutake]|uniref:uncharacterized protein n=1 Tax=Cantharellus anzutake TaxID=1750568 RepID=UPI0019036323|nr:uncharacterized protein EI90DRAFT_2468510 [Cantharellus anzutake]KAF8339187.1 hypothetical protein EI90DRAFT_2468510 [Cantharellus anzutake]